MITRTVLSLVLVGGILSAAGVGAQEPAVPPPAPEAALPPVKFFGGIAYHLSPRFTVGPDRREA